MKKSTLLHDKAKEWLGSKIFFLLIIALFVLQAGFIAIRNSYPMAFDEGFHVGIIQLYSDQYSPFFSNLPDSTGQFGPLATSPSYLYHYLMSFPYRIIELFTQNTFATILALRFINIAIFAAGIVLFRRVLQYSGAALPMIHLVLLTFVLLPIETLTAAHVNYDNLIFLLTAAVMLLSLKFGTALWKRDEILIKQFILLLSLCFLGTQVKYSFLPIFAGIGLFCAGLLGLWVFKRKKAAFAAMRHALSNISKRTALSLGLLLVVSVGLFGWRFGYNLANYGKLMPDCAQVLNVKACMAWGPWARDYTTAQTYTPVAPSLPQIVEFTKVWINIMGGQLFAVLDANNGGAAVSPARALVVGAKVAIIAGIFFVLINFKRFRKNSLALSLFAIVCLTYMIILYLTNYAAYTKYGMPIAIQGRYLLPVLLLMMIVIARAYSFTFENRPPIKAALLAAAFILGIQGAGLLTYLSKTDQAWQWSAAAAAKMETPVKQLGTVSTRSQ